MHIQNSDFKNRFDNKYKNTPMVFGGSPMPILEKALEYVSKGDALDLGVGNGRNTTYLLSKNFHVVGVDVSKEGIKLVEDRVSKDSNLELVVSNVLDYEPDKEFDLVCAIGLLHFLDKESINSLIKKMKKYTKKGGINVVAVRMFQNYRGDLPHIFARNELKNYYDEDGWKILEYNEQENGKRKIASLIAQKQ